MAVFFPLGIHGCKDLLWRIMLESRQSDEHCHEAGREVAANKVVVTSKGIV